MSKVEDELKGLRYWGYYDETNQYIVEIPKEELIKYLKNKLEVENIKIV